MTRTRGTPSPVGLSHEAFFTEYGAAIDRGHAALFAGAGLSRPSGFVDWRGLLREFARELDIDIDIETDLVAVAQYHLNANNQDRSRLHQRLASEFLRMADPSPAHQILARLPIRTFWTTNYDNLLEKALEAQGRAPDVKTAESALTVSSPEAAATVYKMHGDRNDPRGMVITREDYERYALQHTPFLTTLQAELLGKTFLFLGFSFTDPNLDFVLGRLRAWMGTSPRTHYNVMRREQRGDYPSQNEFAYAANKQRLRLQDLQRYGIQTVLVDEYRDIPELLAELERRYYRRQIVVSGAAVDFGPRGQPGLEELCRELGKRIIEQDYNLVSGFGHGIGSSLVMGALEMLYTHPQPQLERRLRLRPFPRVPPKGQTKEAFKTRYRRDLLTGAGFIVFIAGNRASDTGGTPELSPGVREEFEIAREKNLYPLPIGATGWAARELWNEVQANFDTFYPPGTPRRPFETLGNPKASNAQLLDAVFTLIHHLTPRPGTPTRAPARTRRSRAGRP